MAFLFGLCVALLCALIHLSKYVFFIVDLGEVMVTGEGGLCLGSSFLINFNT